MVDSPQKSDAGYEMDMDEEDESGVRGLRELCFHHLTVFRAFLYRMGQLTNVLDYSISRACHRQNWPRRQIHLQKRRLILFRFTYLLSARSESRGRNSSGLHTEQSYCCSAVLRRVVAGIMVTCAYPICCVPTHRMSKRILCSKRRLYLR
ncbi:hypothetical protein F5J12DRAFT_57691 [Pisolithus orientalis]|uniref:uncharacterized protein n=1 Tax=Pisolithus orientalis TaxID=936130 RepID=UPI0022246966|nr:uncharacterized protein F5J12DRAFT_57691 [Pisolithus orientalis]KAI6008885.1 hypothetical protein F5J12DRAFT_57691 [Pisolithus orientalis]